MTEHPVRRRGLLIVPVVVAAFVSGAAAGVLMTSAAASRAAKVTVEGARRLFVYDQTQRLAIAWNAGDLSEALAHARCAYEAEFAEGARWFDTSAIGFSVWGGAFLQAAVVEPNARTAEEVRPMDEAVAHAQIAVVLEPARPDAGGTGSADGGGEGRGAVTAREWLSGASDRPS